MDHVWGSDGDWEKYTKGFLRGGKQVKCSRCGCVVMAKPSGHPSRIDIEEAGVHPDCNVQLTKSILES